MLIFASSVAQATLTFTFTQNFFTPYNSTTNTIYLGSTVNHTSCTTAFCNSCAAQAATVGPGSTEVCSLSDASPSDLLTFQVTSSATSMNFSTGGFYFGNGTSYTAVASYSVTSNTTATVSILMSSICNSLKSDISCTQSFTQPLTIAWGTQNPPTETGSDSGSVTISFRYVNASPSSATWGCSGGSLSTDYEGVCNIVTFPGDSKIYVNSVDVDPSNLPGALPCMDTSGCAATSTDPSGMLYAGTVVFASSSTAMTTATDYATLHYAVGGAAATPTPKYIQGLNNGTPYFLGVASVDQAGILTFFADPTTTNITVTPEPVYGLLSGQGCFIATAAYGSSMAPEVDTFRAFRGKFLMKSKMGNWLAHKYYLYSPPLAEFISHSEVLKLVSRLILWPLLLFVHLSLKFGLLMGSLISILSLIFVITSLWYLVQRRKVLKDGV